MKFCPYCVHKISLLPVLLVLLACSHPEPPVAEVILSKKVINGANYTDPYKYLENPKDPKTVSYIHAENEYAEYYFEGLSKIKNKLVKEFELQDNYGKQQGSIPILIGKYFYYQRIPNGKNFPVHYRKLNGDKAKEELILDENLLAEGAQNFRMDLFLVSPDDSMFLFTYAVNSDEYRLIIRKFDDQTFIDSIKENISGAAWAGDSKSVVFVKNKKEVRVHQVGKPVEQDKIIYLEKRDGLYVDVDLSKSEKFLFITSRNNESSECSFLRSDLKSLNPILIEGIREGHTYFADHYGSDIFLILSDQGSQNRKLFKSFISTPSEKNWRMVLEGSDGYYISYYTIIEEKYLILIEKKDLIASLRLIDLSIGGKDNKITFKEPDGHMEFLYYDKDKQKIVFSFASMLTPVSVYSYDLDSRRLTVRRQPLIKDYKKENYIVDLLWATANDGTKIPISMIHKNGMKQSDGLNPLYLHAYGSYGNTPVFDFNPAMISLLDRGFFLASAHVRGGGDLGREWWNAGKLMKKRNAVTDYIACADYLIKQGYTSKGMITAAGSSAGGLVIGAAVNQRPELFRSALLIDPYVDPLPELIDSTKNKDNPNEWPEFGNPNIPEQYQYLSGYSPYDNIKKQEYPAMLFRTSVQDKNVEYAGPLKMVARLRANKTDNNILLIKTDDRNTYMGDTGESEENGFRAENWAFILDQYGINE
jgi:oligopeptidase B